MKKLSILIVLFCIALSSFAQDQTTFILVRHSEKANDGTNDPALSQAGLERSNDLAAMFAKQQIDALYSTPYKRTRSTLTPLARAKGLEIEEYDPYAGDKMLEAAISKYPSGTVIVSGHSNTIPNLANALLGNEQFEQFSDSDYSNLIIIVAGKTGEGKLVHLSF